MSEEQNRESGDLRDEFRALGDNFKAMFTSAWESEERKNLQSELEAGMKDLGDAFNDLAEDFRTSQTGETIRKEVNDFGERVRSGEVERKAREEILKALKTLNIELEKATENFSSAEEEDSDRAE